REDPRQGVPDLLVVEQRDPLAAVESPGRLAAVTRRGLRPPSEASPQGLGARAKPALAAEHREGGDRSRMSCLILATDLSPAAPAQDGSKSGSTPRHALVARSTPGGPAHGRSARTCTFPSAPSAAATAHSTLRPMVPGR